MESMHETISHIRLTIKQTPYIRWLAGFLGLLALISFAATKGAVSQFFVSFLLGLVSAIILRGISRKLDKKIKLVQYPHLFVSLIFQKEQEKLFTASYLLLSMGCLVYFMVSSQYSVLDVNYTYAFIGFFFIVFIKERILSYRIRKGYFGRNAYEAKQLIDFLAKYKKNVDFRGPDGKPKEGLHPKEVEENVTFPVLEPSKA